MVVVDRSPGLTHAYWPAETSEPVLEQSIGTALRAAAETHGARTALVEGTVDADRRCWTFVELLAASAADTPVGRFLEGRGPGLHHVAFEVDDVPSELARLAAAGERLIDEQPRRGLNGLRVAFVHPEATGGVLAELVDDGDV